MGDEILAVASRDDMLRLAVPPGTTAIIGHDPRRQYVATLGGYWRRVAPLWSTTRPVYTYVAIVVRVVDGDTVHLDVDLGFGVWLRSIPFRLAGCNARELAQDGGKEARDHLVQVLPAGLVLAVRSVKTDKYARWDAQLTMPDGADLVEQLIAEQWAAPWDGQGVAPVPPWPRTVP